MERKKSNQGRKGPYRPKNEGGGEVANIERKISPLLINWIRGAVKLKWLTKEEERQMIIEAKKGDRHARGRLLQTQAGIIFKLAMESRARHRINDLIHEGILGVNEVIDRFDLKKDVRLNTYAWSRIKGRIKDWIKNSVNQEGSTEGDFEGEPFEVYYERLDAQVTLEKLLGRLREEVGKIIDVTERERWIRKLHLFEHYASEKLEDGENMREVAEMNGLSKSRMSRLMKEVREAIIMLEEGSDGLDKIMGRREGAKEVTKKIEISSSERPANKGPKVEGGKENMKTNGVAKKTVLIEPKIPPADKERQKVVSLPSVAKKEDVEVVGNEDIFILPENYFPKDIFTEW